MADGIQVTNAESEVCIQDEYPLLVATTAITNSGSSTGTLTSFADHYWKYWDISGTSDEIIFVETFNNQGVSTRFNNGSTIRMIAQNGSSQASTSHAPSTFNYFKARPVSSLSPSSGYGIRVFDGSGNMTFDSGYAAVNVRKVGILGGSSTQLTGDPSAAQQTIESGVNYIAFSMGGEWIWNAGFNPQIFRYVPRYGTTTPYRVSSTQISTYVKGTTTGPFATAPPKSTAPSVCYMTAIV